MSSYKIVITIVLFYPILIMAQTRTLEDTGNWSDAGIWDGGNIGGAVDDDDVVQMSRSIEVVIRNGESYTIATFTIDRSGVLTIDEGGELIITGLVTVARTFVINVNGDLTIEGNLDVERNLEFNVGSSGSVTIKGDVDLERDAALNIEGPMTVEGSLTTARDAEVNVGNTGSLQVGEELNLGEGSTITGSGPVSAGDCTGTQCDDDQINTTLPVVLASFELSKHQESIVLEWLTFSEINFHYFEIQRANLAGNFETIAKVTGSGNSKEQVDYMWADENPHVGLNYYRLVSNDYDGYREVFPAKAITLKPKEFSISVYPNPISSGNRLNISKKYNQEVEVSLYSISGHKVFHTKTDESSLSLRSLKPGLYLIELCVNGLVQRQQLIVK